MLYKPGVVDGILAGKIWEFDVSQTLITAAFASVAIPAVMIVLSVAQPARALRVATIVVATLNIPYALFNAVGESWTLFFGLFFGLSIGLELMILALILRTAWTWPRTPALSATIPAASANRQPLQAPA